MLVSSFEGLCVITRRKSSIVLLPHHQAILSIQKRKKEGRKLYILFSFFSLLSYNPVLSSTIYSWSNASIFTFFSSFFSYTLHRWRQLSFSSLFLFLFFLWFVCRRMPSMLDSLSSARMIRANRRERMDGVKRNSWE